MQMGAALAFRCVRTAVGNNLTLELHTTATSLFRSGSFKQGREMKAWYQTLPEAYMFQPCKVCRFTFFQ